MELAGRTASARTRQGRIIIKSLPLQTAGLARKFLTKKGKAIYSGENAAVQEPGVSAAGYTQKQFVIDVQKATGSNPDGVAGDETIGNTVTVSRSSHKYHAVVTPLERRMKALGYYSGGNRS